MSIDYEYLVQFCCDYCDIQVIVQGVDENATTDDVIALAQNVMKLHYGFDPLPLATMGVEIENLGVDIEAFGESESV